MDVYSLIVPINDKMAGFTSTVCPEGYKLSYIQPCQTITQRNADQNGSPITTVVSWLYVFCPKDDSAGSSDPPPASD